MEREQKWRMRLVPIAAILSVACGSTIGTGVAPQPPQPPRLSGDLTITTRTSQEISGSFARAGSLITFTSRLVTPTRGELSMVVNGKTLVAALDDDAKTAMWDGQNQAFSLEDRQTLEALELSLAIALVVGQRELFLHERVLYTHVLYWAEAPVGHVLSRQEVTLGEDRALDTPTTRAPDAAVARGCAIGNEGITLIPCNVWISTRFDLGSRCIQKNEYCGQDSNGCMGRCGIGCGSILVNGAGVYTKDCADHDACCRSIQIS